MASATELVVAARYLAAQTAMLRESNRQPSELALPANMPEGMDPQAAAALTDFCLALFNLNEFVYVD
jgi:hypothetical protein